MSTEKRLSGGPGALILLIIVGLVCTRGYKNSGGNYHLARFYKVPYKIGRSEIKSEIDRAADQHRIPRNVMQALAHVESGLNPKAVSHCGAIGVTQVMPFNARRCGLIPSDLFDATHNVRCGSKILQEEIERLGNIRDALTVYNCGKIKCTEGREYATKVLNLAKKLG